MISRKVTSLSGLSRITGQAQILFRFYGSAQLPDPFWFHATDIPKSAKWNTVPRKRPMKFVAFSKGDSIRIEKAYQDAVSRGMVTENGDLESHLADHRLMVKEDGLFSVDVHKLEIAPTYWNGPSYDIRRGVWFYETSPPQPCDWKLARALDDAYDKVTDESQGLNELDIDVTDTLSHEYGGEGTGVSISVRITAKNPEVVVMTTKSGSLMDIIRSTHKIRRGGYVEKIDKKNAEDTDTEGSTGSAENILTSLFALKDGRSKLESQMEHDYSMISTNQSGNNIREVDHLVLCIHGIGQKLSQRLENMSFVHDINLFRKLLKQTHETEKNNRVQVLPVLWRHDVTFAMTRDQIDPANTSILPVSLQDITVDGITPVRNMVGDVVLDVLLYNESIYKKQILDNVTLQANTIVRDFIKLNQCKRRPKISVIGHSLGSVIAFDLLSTKSSKGHVLTDKIAPSKTQLEFSVENFVCLGSPLGLYQLIMGKTIANDALMGNIKSFYNIFHPSDPISYRVEPLIDSRAAALKPEIVPYTRGGLTSGIQGLTDFGQKLSENASSFWNTVASYYKQQQEKQKLEEEEEEEELNAEKPISGDKKILKPEQIEKIKKNLRVLNSTGRIDYSLQEGVLDISLLAAIASHMSYFENEDVAQFVMGVLRPDWKAKK